MRENLVKENHSKKKIYKKVITRKVLETRTAGHTGHLTVAFDLLFQPRSDSERNENLVCKKQSTALNELLNVEDRYWLDGVETKLDK